MLRSLLKVNQHFEETYPLHLQFQRISRARYQHESSWKAEVLLASYFHTGTVLSLFFNPEDVGDVFL
jgi:hypothetical protein